MINKLFIELKDTMAHVGAALKTHLVNSVKNTWNTVYQLTMFSRLNSNNLLEYKPRIVSLFNSFYFLSIIIIISSDTDTIAI